MEFNFNTIPADPGFVSVPEGTYECEIVDVRSRRSKDDSERWSFMLRVVEGEYAGKLAAWDSITWSERGVYRVRNVLQALGIDVTGMVRIDSDDLMGRRARVEIVHEEWEDPVTGNRQKRSVVPYLGYVASSEADGDWGNGATRTA